MHTHPDRHHTQINDHLHGHSRQIALILEPLAIQVLTVRLACIDAPESAQTPYSQRARKYLQQHLPIGRDGSLIVKTTDR